MGNYLIKGISTVFHLSNVYPHGFPHFCGYLFILRAYFQLDFRQMKINYTYKVIHNVNNFVDN